MKVFSFSRELILWYEENKRSLPWRETTDPYKIWVSEIMLQQTRVEAVKPYYKRFLEALPTVESLADADPEHLNKLWQGLGYYSRVRNMQKAAKVCQSLYQGKMPGTYEELRRLPGIGEYTAGAIASFAYKEPVPAVDGNVLRVVSRYLALELPVDTPKAKERITEFVRSVLPEDLPDVFNQALIELGATLCGPDRAARCGGCPLLGHCQAFEKGMTELLPRRTPKKPKRVEERTLLLLVTEDGRMALCKRPEKGLLRGLWEIPALEGKATPEQVGEVLKDWGCLSVPGEIQPLPHARHVFSHVVWEMDGYRVFVKTVGSLSFFTKEERRALAVPSAFQAYFRYLF